MLSYQHSYHAGNLADIHKHATLCYVLDYLIQKDKPLSYIETHAGRGMYDLTSTEAQKTGEAAIGIEALLASDKFREEHIYLKTLRHIQQFHGKNIYPGSPMIADTILRETDKIHLAELHPQEYDALAYNFRGLKMAIKQENGLVMANRLLPPEPRRGIMLIDPSYEIKTEYALMAEFIINMHKKWNVGVIMLWYPILETPLHQQMIATLLNANITKAVHHQIMFEKSVHTDHRMKGSGLFIANAPFGIEDALTEIERFYK
jgi:23S rRNA (adenine2030-N6)-methyltransferase